jgi:hypothetical protein
MLAEIAGVIEPDGLQIGAGRLDFGQGRFGQDLGGNIVDRGIGDFMNEADIAVLAGCDSGDDFAPRDLGIDDGLASAPSVVDHHDEILHQGLIVPALDQASDVNIADNQKLVKTKIRKNKKTEINPMHSNYYRRGSRESPRQRT